MKLILAAAIALTLAVPASAQHWIGHPHQGYQWHQGQYWHQGWGHQQGFVGGPAWGGHGFVGHHWWHGRYWSPGVGPCWSWSPLGWIWICG